MRSGFYRGVFQLNVLVPPCPFEVLDPFGGLIIPVLFGPFEGVLLYYHLFWLVCMQIGGVRLPATSRFLAALHTVGLLKLT